VNKGPFFNLMPSGKQPAEKEREHKQEVGDGEDDRRTRESTIEECGSRKSFQGDARVQAPFAAVVIRCQGPKAKAGSGHRAERGAAIWRAHSAQAPGEAVLKTLEDLRRAVR
jgi:hypothetical protein